MSQATKHLCDHDNVVVPTAADFYCPKCQQMVSWLEYVKIHGLTNNTEKARKKMSIKDVKDTITVITLPCAMEDWMIERITEYIALLLNNQRKEICDSMKEKMVDYCYDFAWHYGRLYHIGDAEKIKAAISEKFRLPEEFFSLLNSGQNVQVSDTTEAP